jgi:hypothetical protein
VLSKKWFVAIAAPSELGRPESSLAYALIIFIGIVAERRREVFHSIAAF